MSTEINNIEQYDRQIRTFGVSETHKLNSCNIYLCGLEGGLGTEVAKNLALSGVKNLFLIDNFPINKKDVEFGYYYNIKDIGKSRALTLLPFIQELNPYCSVSVIDYNWHTALEDNIGSSCIVICNELYKVAANKNICSRHNNIKTVYVCAKGLAGYVFVDCINNHIVYDLNGESIEPVEINNILNNGQVLCNNHNFQQNDIIKFTNLKGTNLDFLNDKVFKISSISNNSFYITYKNDIPINRDDFHFINGTAEIVLQPTIFNHTSLEKQLSISNSQYSIHGFDYENSKNIIDLLNENRYLENYEPWSENMNKVVDKIDRKYQPLVRCIGIELAPVNSILGGIASTEVIKLMTNKYSPITQFYTWNDFSIYPKKNPETTNSSHIENLFGSAFIKKMENSKVGMVGCGALGCEWLKNLSLLNIGINDGYTDITDPDHIEVSNLSRQFLFRPENVKQSKSRVAMNSIKNNNSKMNINAFENKLSNENNQFTTQFFNNKDIIINALDNLEARKYVDNQCFINSLPLFESGTMGMKGNTQSVIPFLTETYSNSNDPEIEKQFAVCTIKNFPNTPHHTIHWARDYFEFFNRAPKNINNYLQRGEEYSIFFDSLSLFEKNQAIKDINMFLGENTITGAVDLLEWAKKLFEKEFNHNILQLLYCFPKDHITNGDLFWSNGKRCPEPLDYSTNLEFVIDFIEATLHILCQCFDIYQEFSRNEIKQNLIQSTLTEYVPSSNVKIAKNDKELKETTTVEKVTLLPNLNMNYNNFIPQEFEKDDDLNWHIAWINAASNCRALNYGINITSKFETKGIAGKIIPAVATTTSTIVGLICMDLLKYYSDCKLEDYKSWFVNMADNTSVCAEPIKAPKIKVGNNLVNSWTKYIYNKRTTFSEFIEYYENLWNIKINMILYESKMIYTSFMSSDTNINILELFKTEYNCDITKEQINLTIIPESDDIEELPDIILKYF